MCNLFSGNSSVGRARPCQGRGREFESRFPLQTPYSYQQEYTFYIFSIRKYKNKNIGWMVEWLYSGLQNRGHQFESGSSLHFSNAYTRTPGWRNW